MIALDAIILCHSVAAGSHHPVGHCVQRITIEKAGIVLPGITNFRVPYDNSMYTYDTIDFIAENYCDSVVNGCHYEKNAFEPDIIIKQFGKGFGGVEDYYFSASAIPNDVVWDHENEHRTGNQENYNSQELRKNENCCFHF